MLAPQERLWQTLRELDEAWDALQCISDSEHWDVANARVTALLTQAETLIRDLKRAQGYSVHPPGFVLPWLISQATGRPARQAS
ncbi:MAG: hypothetical protein K6U87_16150 [Firmicutes bacterium]|nr:hypothetical protein [Bacillota bacterium]